MTNNGHKKQQRSTTGGSGELGQTRRDTERAYLAAMADACTPDIWREVVEKAVEDARAGDAKARDWLASYLVGRPEHAAMTLHRLAVQEASGRDPIDMDVLTDRMLKF